MPRKESATGHFGERAQVQLDDIWVFQQLATSTCVGILALVENIATIGHLQTTSSILFHHQDGNSLSVDALALDEHFILQYR